MARRGEVIEDPMFGEGVTILDISADTNGELLRLQLVVSVGGRVPFPMRILASRRASTCSTER
jgi:hypothetical protein